MVSLPLDQLQLHLSSLLLDAMKTKSATGFTLVVDNAVAPKEVRSIPCTRRAIPRRARSTDRIIVRQKPKPTRQRPRRARSADDVPHSLSPPICRWTSDISTAKRSAADVDSSNNSNNAGINAIVVWKPNNLRFQQLSLTTTANRNPPKVPLRSQDDSPDAPPVPPAVQLTIPVLLPPPRRPTLRTSLEQSSSLRSLDDSADTSFPKIPSRRPLPSLDDSPADDPAIIPPAVPVVPLSLPPKISARRISLKQTCSLPTVQVVPLLSHPPKCPTRRTSLAKTSSLQLLDDDDDSADDDATPAAVPLPLPQKVPARKTSLEQTSTSFSLPPKIPFRRPDLYISMPEELQLSLPELVDCL